ncbi:hypothetical protein FHU38_002938 [Saccharomonospora amisosensis]|uniref:VWA domain containing CoxE-like protein n=1 Tax=Saccharomonospora amisosensis TaxID=1128677 RepID=A0A7X5ZR76_9PSEU|nr:VWA domain-containing protein [Saccharomonospora amisosensis]NIJ12594.1 hypothetical protein [Saccharomonospora amisosensis]
MDSSIHRFTRLLRLRGIRISVPEILDAIHAAAQPGVLAERELLRAALRVALVKDHRDEPAFDEVFDAFFGLVRVGTERHGHGHGHGHDDLADTGELERFTLSEEPGRTPEQGHEHGKPSDIRDYFDSDDLAQRYNLHQEANKIDMSALTEEIVFSQEEAGAADADYRVRLETSRLHGAGAPGRLAGSSQTHIDAELTLAEQDRLLRWLDSSAAEDGFGDEDDAAGLRGRLAGVLENLPAALKRHVEKLLELETTLVEQREREQSDIDGSAERDRAELEESLRRLARTFRGALNPRRKAGARGRIDAGRTMRTNMGYDAVPFRPVTMRRIEDRPRLVVLADVSLSVRATAWFTLHVVHGLQNLFAQVRSFAFVAQVAEVTELFAEAPPEQALRTILAGSLLDVDANSDYGAVIGEFLAEHASAVTRRTTILVLGDGRGNGNDPNLSGFAELTRRARETVWLTPEPRYSWQLGRCDLPLYAEHCDRIRVVRDLSGLSRMADETGAQAVRR